MTTSTGFGWNNTSPFQVTICRKGVGIYKTVNSSENQKTKRTYTLIRNATTLRPTISLIKPCQALLNYNQCTPRKIIASPIPTGTNQNPITTGQLWPRY